MACTAPEKYYKRDPRFFAGVAGLTKDARKALGNGVGMITVACGKCADCRLARAHEWSLRVMHEASLYPHNVFVTLTYDPQHLPADWNLRYRDFQLFMHKLRKRYVGAGRFMMCGEYGDDFGRPHYHAILFNVRFPDAVHWKTVKGIPYYTSAKLSQLWGNGFCTIGDVTLQSASYVARYSLKKITGPNAGAVYQYRDANGQVFDRDPPFLQASNQPGIGYDWFQRYHSDVFPCDYMVYGGKKFPVPRYYSKLMERLDGALYERVRRKRVKAAVALASHPDNTSRRLHDRQLYEREVAKSFERNKL